MAPHRPLTARSDALSSFPRGSGTSIVSFINTIRCAICTAIASTIIIVSFSAVGGCSVLAAPLPSEFESLLSLPRKPPSLPFVVAVWVCC